MPAEESLTSLHARRACAGDAQSVDWLFARFSPLLLAQARHRLGPQLARLYDPEDLVQDAWAVALPRLGELSPRDGRSTPVVLRFLATTILLRISNLMKKQLARPASEADPGSDERAGARLSQLPATTSGVLARAIRCEATARVLAVLEELSPEEREVVVLRGIEENPIQEIAAALGMRPNTISVRYHRALQHLRAKLPESAFGELPD